MDNLTPMNHECIVDRDERVEVLQDFYEIAIRPVGDDSEYAQWFRRMQKIPYE